MTHQTVQAASCSFENSGNVAEDLILIESAQELLDDARAQYAFLTVRSATVPSTNFPVEGMMPKVPETYTTPL